MERNSTDQDLIIVKIILKGSTAETAWGALGQLLVEGDETPDLYQIKQKGSAVASNH